MKKFTKQAVRVLALLLVAATLMLSLASCKDTSKVDVIRSDNFSVTAAMVTYSLYDTYHYYYNQFGADGMLAYFGIDTTKPLNQQYSDETKGVTWFDVFKTEAIDGFKSALAHCEAALKAGLEITEEDTKYIQTEIDSIEELAAKDKLTLNEYIKKIYGKNVKVDDIKKSLEIFRLANKMRYKDYNDVVISDSELEELAKKEGNTYLQREILVFELTLSNLSDKTAKIKEYAQKMKEATTAEEFRQLAADFIKTDYCVNLSSKKEVATETVQNNVSEDDKDALTSWFFASGTTVGSTYLKEGTAAYTVYMAASEPAYDETPTRNLYTIVFEPFAYGSLDACKAKAEEVYNKWKADGATLEGFKALAMQYSTDQVSVYSGGLYANMMKDQMIEELDKWLFDENLAVGSHTIMSAEQGCHIVYYAGEGVATWKAPLVEQIREEKATELSSNYSQTYRVVTLEGNMKYVKAK
jgi:hypothetical protein